MPSQAKCGPEALVYAVISPSRRQAPNSFSLMLDLHYDRLVSDGISSWAQAQGERGRVGPQPWPAPAPAGGWRGW